TVSFSAFSSYGAVYGTVAPSYYDSTKVEYNFGRGINLKPSEGVELILPDSLAGRTLDFVYITHKQTPSQMQICQDPKIDCKPGWTSFEVLPDKASNLPNDWRYWGGKGSGIYNSKFAEIRSGEGETDNLYEWYRHGHLGINGNDKSYEPLIPRAFRVRSVGQDSIWLQKVVVKFLSPEIKKTKEFIFSSGLQFGDINTTAGRKYPGHAYKGDYGSAIVLGRKRNSRINQDNIYMSKGDIKISTESMNGNLKFINIACGDMKPVPSGEDPDKYRGNGKLSVSVVTDQSIYKIMDHENVGTSGVMTAPVPNELINGAIKEIIIHGSGSPISVMGLQLGFD
ncbi:MAG TPA: hypothetical protein VN132_09810, partial [Bdellovibrio sp.]|nr:hypothetical protein [Bdellovibrio sp.]